jgi:hypothetical protein
MIFFLYFCGEKTSQGENSTIPYAILESRGNDGIKMVYAILIRHHAKSMGNDVGILPFNSLLTDTSEANVILNLYFSN